MKRNLVFFSILFTVTLFSCKKEDPIVVERNSTGLLTRVIISGETYMEYTYLNSGLIYEEKSKFHYTKHTYNSSNLVEKSESYWDPSIFSSSSDVLNEAMKRKEWVNPQNTPKSATNTYFYGKNGQLNKSTANLSNGTINITTYDCNDHNRISRQTFYSENSPSGYIDFFYDEPGNLIKRLHYYILTDGTDQLQTTTEYEYDTMHNPYLAFRQLLNPCRYTNLNNITKETYTLHFEVDSWIQKVQITTNKYEYNELGYPLKVNDETVYEYN
jgi:hypothetical protein